MKRVLEWFSRLWGDDERQVNFNEMIHMPANRPHWSARPVRTIVSFYIRHWQWVWGTAIAVVGLWVAILSMTN